MNQLINAKRQGKVPTTELGLQDSNQRMTKKNFFLPFFFVKKLNDKKFKIKKK